MKVNRSNEPVIKNQETSESTESTKSNKSTAGSGRATQSTKDTVETTSASRSTESTGKRKLTSDQQKFVGNIDPENLTALRSGADPRAAMEAARPKRESSTAGSGKLPDGQTTQSRDLSKYNAPTGNAPETLKESIGKLGQRADELRGAGGQNASDQLNANNLASKNQGSARAHMNAKDGVVEDAWNWVKKKVSEITADDVKEAATEKVLSEASDKAGKAGGSVVDTLAKPLTGMFTVQEVLGKEEGPKAYLDGWRALLGDPDKRPGMPGKDGVQDVPPDVDGTTNPDWKGLDGDSLLPEQLRTRNILQGTTGRGPGGGEVVNPSPEGTGGGKSKWIDDHGAEQARLTSDNSKFLISQPAGPEEERGFQGLSGSGAGGRGGNVDFEDGRGYQGALKSEEPGDVQTAPSSGHLGHLIGNTEEDEEDDKRSR